MASAAWPPRNLALLERALLDLRDAVADDSRFLALTDDEQMWLTRFLVVRATGYLEQVFFDCTKEHLRVGSSGSAQSFAMSFMERSQNPSSANLKNMFKRLDSELARDLNEYLNRDGCSRRSSLDALVQARHSVAHGLNETVRRERALEWTVLALDLAEWIVRGLAPRSVPGQTRGLILA